MMDVEKNYRKYRIQSKGGQTNQKGWNILAQEFSRSISINQTNFC